MRTASNEFSHDGEHRGLRCRHPIQALIACTVLIATQGAAQEPPPEPELQLDFIVEEGDPAPGTSGEFNLGFSVNGSLAPLIDDSGRVYFFAASTETDPFGIPLEGIWAGTAAGVTFLAVDGQILPQFTPTNDECGGVGPSCGQLFNTSGVFYVSPDGEVVIRASREDTLGTLAILTGTASGNLTPILTAGQEPGFDQSKMSRATESGVYQVGNLIGDAPFGSGPGGSLTEGELTDFVTPFIGEPPPAIADPVTITAITGTSTSDGASIGALFGLNEDADFLFRANLSDSTTAIYLNPSEAGVPVSLLARSGDTTPGIDFGNFLGLGQSISEINNNEVGFILAFWNDPEGSSPSSDNAREGIWRFDDSGNLVLVVSERAGLTDPTFVSTGVFTGGSLVAFSGVGNRFVNPVIAPNGDIYFLDTGRQVDADGVLTGEEAGGLWRAPADGGPLELVFRERDGDTPGTPLLNGNQVASIGFGQSLYGFDEEGRLVIDLIAQAPDNTASQGIYMLEADGTLRLIIEEGQQVEVAPGVTRTVDAFSFDSTDYLGGTTASFRNGRLAFNVEFTDNTVAIFRASFAGPDVLITDFIWSGACGDSNWHAICADSNWNDNEGAPATFPPGDAVGTQSAQIVDSDVVISDRAVNLASLNATGSLTVSQNLVLVNGGSIEDLILTSGGGIFTADTLTLTGDGNVWTGGSINNDGVTLQEGAALAIMGGTDPLSVSGTLTLNGTANWTTGTIDGGEFQFGLIRIDGGNAALNLDPADGTLTLRDVGVTVSDFGEIVQSGGVLNLEDASIDLLSGGRYEIQGGEISAADGDASAIRNNGTFLKTGAETATVAVTFENEADGITTVTEGVLRFTGPTTWNGRAPLLSPGTALEIAGDATLEGVDVAGSTDSGVLRFDGGEIGTQADTGANVFDLDGSGKVEVIGSASFGGTGFLVNTGNFDVVDGAFNDEVRILNNSGVFTIVDGSFNDDVAIIVDGGQVNVTGGSLNDNVAIFLSETGELMVTGGSFGNQVDIVLDGGGELTVEGGTFASTVDVENMGGDVTLTQGEFGAIIDNSGDVRKTGAETATITSDFENQAAGTVTVEEGVLRFTDPSQWAGDLSISAGATAEIDTTVATLGPTVGQGLSVDGNGVLRFSGAEVIVGSGTENTFDLTGDDFSITDGKVEVAGGSTLTGDGSIFNIGNFELIDGNIEANIDNSGVFTLVDTGSIVLAEGTMAITNGGTIRKTGEGRAVLGNASGSLVANPGLSIVNDGDLDVRGGLLALDGLASLDGISYLRLEDGSSITVAAGAQMELINSVTQLAGETTLQGEGMLMFSGTNLLDGTGQFNVSEGSEVVQKSGESSLTLSRFLNQGTVRVESGGRLTIVETPSIEAFRTVGFEVDPGSVAAGSLLTVRRGSWIIEEDARLEVNTDIGTEIRRIGPEASVTLIGAGGSFNDLDELEVGGFINRGQLALDGRTLSLRGAFSTAASEPNEVGEVLVGLLVGIQIDVEPSIGFDNRGGTVTLRNGATLDVEKLTLGGSLTGIGTVNGGYVGDNNTVVSPGASPGTLTINGDYVQPAGSVLEIELGGTEAGTYDQLIVNGTAAFAAGSIIDIALIDPNPNDGVDELFRPSTGDLFNFLLAEEFVLGDGANLSDLFTFTDLPRGLDFEFDLATVDDMQVLQLMSIFGSSLRDLDGLTAAQAAVAAALDDASIGTGTAGLLDFALAIDGLASDAARRDALDQASLSFTTALFDLSTVAARASADHIGRHLDLDNLIWGNGQNRRTTTGSGTSSRSAALGATENGVTNLPSGETTIFEHNGLRMFMAGSYDFGDFDASASQTGFDYDGGAGTLGAEYADDGARWLAGVAGTASVLNAEADLDRGELDLESYALSAYGLARFDRAVIDGIASYGWVRGDYSRNFAVPGQAFIANGEPEGNFLTITGRFALPFELGRATLGPIAQLSYTDIDIDRFVETGAGAASLNVAESESSYFAGQLGVRGSVVFDTGWGRVEPRLSVAYQDVFDDDSPVLNARFAGAPDNPFAIPTDENADDALALSAGLVVRSGGRITVSADYHGLLLNDGGSQHAIVARLRGSF